MVQFYDSSLKGPNACAMWDLYALLLLNFCFCTYYTSVDGLGILDVTYFFNSLFWRWILSDW